MKRLLGLILLLCAFPVANATTWYIRTDGGTATQCTGTTNAAYPGSGSAQACAYNHPYWLLDQSNFEWLIAANDTIQFEDVGPYYMGQNNGTHGYTWGFCAGNEADCHPKALPNGVKMYGVNKGSCHVSDHSALSNPTRLIGINSLYELFVLSGTNGADVECIDISSLSNCSASSGTALTVTNTALSGNVATYSWTYPSFGYWAQVGEPISVSGSTHSGGIFNVTGAIVLSQTGSGTGSGTFTIALTHASVTSAADTGTVYWAGACGAPGQNSDYIGTGFVFQGLASDSGPRNLTMKDVAIHGLRTQAIAGGKINTTSGDTTTISDVFLIGNGSAGWNYDAIAGGCGTSCESIGTINISYLTANWNGCVEVKGGAIGANGYNNCVDQAYGGYGDAFSMLATQGAWNLDHLTFKNNTQDGLDGLHFGDDPLHQPTITAAFIDSEGNEGAAIKLGGATSTLTNYIAGANCNVFATGSNFPGNPTGWNVLLGSTCRANDAMAFGMSDGDTLTVENGTVYGEQQVGWDIDAGGGCTSATTCTLIFKNNTTMGFISPQSGNYMSGIFFGGVNLLSGGSSVARNNAWYHTGSGGTVCPSNGAETNYVCTDPKFVAESNINAMNVQLLGSSPLIGAGVFISGLTTDFAGATRPNPPSIGAYELAGTPTAAAPTYSPNGATSSSPIPFTLSTTSPAAIICQSNSVTPATNGSTGCTTGSLYTGTITASSTGTWHAVAGGSGYVDSTVSNATFTVNPQAATPVWTPSSPHTDTAAFSASIAESTGGAIVCWKLGSAPVIAGASSCPAGSTLYSGLFTISASGTYHAVAGGPGLTDSADAPAAYTITPPATGGVLGQGTIRFQGIVNIEVQ